MKVQMMDKFTVCLMGIVALAVTCEGSNSGYREEVYMPYEGQEERNYKKGKISFYNARISLMGIQIYILLVVSNIHNI